MTKNLLAFTLLSLSLSIFAQERFALVIGNADYQISPLANALNDAQDIALALENLDFKVTLVENADRRTMRDAIYNFGEKLNKDTVGLFYYSGHAVQYQGENYLIPINAISSIKKRRHLDDEAVKSRYVSTEMTARESQLNFIFLDACRNNPLPAESRGITQGLANSQNAEGTLIAYSTSPGRTAEDGEGRNSPYTKNLLKQIYTPNQPIELMLKDVKNAVSIDTNGEQLPWYESSITGNFCFKTTSDGCAENVITVIDNPYLKDLYDLDVVDLNNGNNYVGQIKDGLMHGKGVITYESGIKYQGEFTNGKRHGEGTIIQLNGNRFEGKFFNDMRHGKGTFRWINGAVMKTEWSEDNRIYNTEAIYKGDRNIFLKYNGLGIYTFPSGSYYQGEFKDDVFHGYGTYVGPEGSLYKGQFENGNRSGNGTLIMTNGNRYEGTFINNMLTGQGRYTSWNGDSYFGEFLNDKFHGQGVLTKGDENSYRGGFLNNKYHGQGVLTLNGVIKEGQFEDGKLI